MKKQRKHCTPEEKVAIAPLRALLLVTGSVQSHLTAGVPNLNLLFCRLLRHQTMGKAP
jgi:hypothetical protein